MEEETQKASMIKQTPLTSVFIDPKAKTFRPVQDIKEQLDVSDIKNIALTGPYGSGKSSVLKTLQHVVSEERKANKWWNKELKLFRWKPIKTIIDFFCKHQDDYFLDISLASLESDMKQSKNKDSVDEKPKKMSDTDDIDRLIEYSILQQIIYREKSCDILNSRFKRIKSISRGHAAVFSACSLLAFIAWNVLLYPKAMVIPALVSFFSCSVFWHRVWIFSSLIYLFAIAFIVIRRIIRSSCNLNVSKLNIKEGEVEVNENTSIFNKHLDEIIYFFSSTRYEVVIIEDLDRFETHSIFLKLRELNMLLNASKEVNRKITFIYAVRDDIFIDTHRTKFFDYIVTVVPYINSSNACDKLLGELRRREVSNNEISDSHCEELGFFIDDMRLLKNIVNEYMQYREIIFEGFDHTKLLGMMLYKNYFPEDFAALHNRKGAIWDIVSRKNEFVVKITQELRNKIQTHTEKIKEERDTFRQLNGNELRSIYVMKLLEMYNFKPISFNYMGKKYAIKSIIEDEELFDKVMQGEIKQFNYYYHYTRTTTQDFSVDFQKLENEIDPQFSYNERLKQEPSSIKTLAEEVNNYEFKISKIKTLTLANLLLRYDVDISNYVAHLGDKGDIIVFLLQQGYIQEDYFDYISYFHDGIISVADKFFLTKLKVQKMLNPDYPLNKVENLVKKIPQSSYNAKGILNYDLVYYLSGNIDSHEDEWNRIVKTVERLKKAEFVLGYYQNKDNAEAFISAVLSTWTTFVNYIFDGDVHGIDYLELILRFVPVNSIRNFDNPRFIELLSSNYSWLVSKLLSFPFEQIQAVTTQLDVKYKELSESSSELFNYVVQAGAYECTHDNLSKIVEYIDKSKRSLYTKAGFTTIYSLNHSAFKETMINRLEEFVQAFPDNSTEEAESAIIEIIEADVDPIVKSDYLMKQENKIDSISSLSKKNYDFALELDLVKPTWLNIAIAYKAYKDSLEDETSSVPSPNDVLISFIENHSDVLGQTKTKNEITNDDSKLLFDALIRKNDLKITAYTNIIGAFTCYAIGGKLNQLDNDKLKCMIKNGKIEFNPYYFEHINEYFSTLSVDFITRSKKKFINNLNDFPVDESLALKLALSQKAFTKLEKRKIFDTILSDEISNNQLGDEICKNLEQTGVDSVELNVLVNLLGISSNKNYKLRLVSKMFQTISYSNNNIKSILEALGDNYALVAKQSGHRPKFSNTNTNRYLFQYLEDQKFISSFELKEDEMIQVNTKIIK